MLVHPMRVPAWPPRRNSCQSARVHVVSGPLQAMAEYGTLRLNKSNEQLMDGRRDEPFAMSIEGIFRILQVCEWLRQRKRKEEEERHRARQIGYASTPIYPLR